MEEQEKQKYEKEIKWLEHIIESKEESEKELRQKVHNIAQWIAVCAFILKIISGASCSIVSFFLSLVVLFLSTYLWWGI